MILQPLALPDEADHGQGQDEAEPGDVDDHARLEQRAVRLALCFEQCVESREVIERERSFV